MARREALMADVLHEGRGAEPVAPCRHLRSKTYSLDMTVRPSGNEEGHTPCWCFRTQQVFGPDGGVATRRACTEGRGCFEADQW